MAAVNCSVFIIPDMSGICNTHMPKYNRSHKRLVISIISYDPLWETMKKKGITTYTLIQKYSFSKGTLDSLKHNRNISTATLNDICNILHCEVSEVLKHIPDE